MGSATLWSPVPIPRAPPRAAEEVAIPTSNRRMSYFMEALVHAILHVLTFEAIPPTLNSLARERLVAHPAARSNLPPSIPNILPLVVLRT